MMDARDSNEPSVGWFWSQSGNTLGPVDLAELHKLADRGSVLPDTWVFDPVQRTWVAASSITGLFSASAAAAAEPAPGPAPAPTPTHAETVVYCRSCGATNSPFAIRCASCGHEAAAAVGASGIDPKLAAVCCRASVLAVPILSWFIVGPAIAPAIAWALGRGDPRVVAEAKETFNCLLTMLIVFACATVFGLVGAILIVPPVLAAVVIGGLAVYSVVVGIMGLVALSNDRAFRYPWIWRLIK